jgi:hypothetical protein
MDKKPFLDRSLLIPIGIGIFSIVGILIVILAVLIDQPQAEVPAQPTVTPFKFILLATETFASDPALETHTPEGSLPNEPPIPISTVASGFPAFPTQAPSQIPILATNTVQSSIPAPAEVTATMTSSVAGTTVSGFTQKYDNVDQLLLYYGNWVSRTDVANAYQGTLHVSNRVGNDVAFSFVGQQIAIGYLGEPGLGSITISIDDDEFRLNQSGGNRWLSPEFSSTEHFVILLHEEGDTINLDYVEIIQSN